MPHPYRKIKLGDILEVQNGYAFKSNLFSNVDGFPLIRIRDLGRNQTETKYIGEHDDRYVVKNGDILIGMDGDFLCSVWGGGDALLNQRVCRLQDFSEEIDRSYVFYLLQGKLNEIHATTSFVTVKHLSSKQIKEIKCTVPPVQEQKRIVEILKRAEGIIRLRKDQLAKTRALIPALFIDMFGDPATNPKGWDMRPLGETDAAIRYGIGQPLPQIPNGLPFLRATNVKRGRISEKGLVFIDPNANPMERNPPLIAEDIIVVRSGAYTGDIAQVGNKYAGAIAGYDLVLRPSEKHLSEFISAYLLTSHVQEGYIHAHKTRAAQPHLNAKQLGAISVPVPSLEMQERFKKNYYEITEVEAQKLESLKKQESLFQSLLHHAFQGTLTAPAIQEQEQAA